MTTTKNRSKATPVPLGRHKPTPADFPPVSAPMPDEIREGFERATELWGAYEQARSRSADARRDLDATVRARSIADRTAAIRSQAIKEDTTVDHAREGLTLAERAEAAAWGAYLDYMAELTGLIIALSPEWVQRLEATLTAELDELEATIERAHSLSVSTRSISNMLGEVTTFAPTRDPWLGKGLGRADAARRGGRFAIKVEEREQQSYRRPNADLEPALVDTLAAVRIHRREVSAVSQSALNGPKAA